MSTTGNQPTPHQNDPARHNAQAPRALPDQPRRGPGKALTITAVVVAVAIIAGLVVWAVNDRRSDQADPATTVRIGTTEASASFWPVLKEKAAQRGITVDVVNFADYTQPNQALSQGQVDLNYFQHLFFLANYNVEKGDDLVPLSATYVVPLSLYSKKHTALDQFGPGSVVAIPNDQTNQGRALLLLQSAGLLKLRDGGSALSTPADVITSASKVSVKPVDARATVTALGGVDGSVVNNGFARDAKIDPNSALFADSATSSSAEPYINVFAVRAADKDKPALRTVAEVWHDPQVVKAVVDDSQGSAVAVTGKSQADLQTILDDLQTTIKNHS